MCQDAPDYTPLAQASEHSANVAMALGGAQLANNMYMYNDIAPTMKRISSAQADAMDEQIRQGRDYYNYNVETFRPLERGLVRDAENFNTERYRNELAEQAAADAGRAFSRTNQANTRAMRAMGINPNSGAGRALNTQATTTLAATRAGAMNTTRRQAEQTGYARKLDAAGLGRGLPGASTAAYSAATGAGATGANAAVTGMNAYNQGAGIGYNTIMQGQQIGVQGLGNVLNAQAQYAGSSNAGLGSAAGMIAGAAIMAPAGTFTWGSDRRLKENIEIVGADGRTGLNIYEFSYIGGDKRYRGVMADEVYEKYPGAVLVDPKGFMRVDYAQLGMQMQEVA